MPFYTNGARFIPYQIITIIVRIAQTAITTNPINIANGNLSLLSQVSFNKNFVNKMAEQIAGRKVINEITFEISYSLGPVKRATKESMIKIN